MIKSESKILTIRIVLSGDYPDTHLFCKEVTIRIVPDTLPHHKSALPSGRWGNSWTSWCSTKKNFKVGKGAQVENLPFVIWSFCASVDVGRFKHASGLGSTNLQNFRFNFPTETTLSITYFLKNSEISTLFGSSPVLRHNNACGWNV